MKEVLGRPEKSDERRGTAKTEAGDIQYRGGPPPAPTNKRTMRAHGPHTHYSDTRTTQGMIQ